MFALLGNALESAMKHRTRLDLYRYLLLAGGCSGGQASSFAATL